MRRIFKKFADDQSGAVTVDWVILTASIIGLTVILAGIVTDSVDDVVAYILIKLAS
ncbi:hypothetical protein [Sulfitobacter sp. PS-8MA]|uniref:hypothetical protein n=1 Tax=Sulfitobacter sp. PS-8MA TaxID=3237707 RepID=UPI0034C6BFF3